ncbi:hypothetical protein BT69DRAFT_1291068 [Atractiella rhizophila]|nr:hypothetical protein BT69DRAFT_1291068 [Atractiella rhizophila]
MSDCSGFSVGSLGRQMVTQHPKFLKCGSAEPPSTFWDWLRRRNQRDRKSSHVHPIKTEY